MPAIVKLVAIVVCVFFFVPLGVVAAASLSSHSSPVGKRIVRARREILMTATAVGGTVLLAGAVSTSYALIVGFTCLVVVLCALISEYLESYRVASEYPSGAAVVVPRPRRIP